MGIQEWDLKGNRGPNAIQEGEVFRQHFLSLLGSIGFCPCCLHWICHEAVTGISIPPRPCHSSDHKSQTQSSQPSCSASWRPLHSSSVHFHLLCSRHLNCRLSSFMYVYVIITYMCVHVHTNMCLMRSHYMCVCMLIQMCVDQKSLHVCVCMLIQMCVDQK